MSLVYLGTPIPSIIEIVIYHIKAFYVITSWQCFFHKIVVAVACAINLFYKSECLIL